MEHPVEPEEPAPETTPLAGESRPVGSAEPLGVWSAPLLATLAGCTLFFAYYQAARMPETIPGLRIGNQDVGSVPFSTLNEHLKGAVERYLAEAIVLRYGDSVLPVPRARVGLRVDLRSLETRVRNAGHSGNPFRDVFQRSLARRGRLSVALDGDLDQQAALEFLTDLKPDVDRSALDARLDLENHSVTKEQPGHFLNVYASLGVLSDAVELGADEVHLSLTQIEPRVKAQDLDNINISTVLGNWETRYSASAVDSDRTYNLKVGADHLNGHILKPHETFSFNEVVGDRTEREGYRVAPVISAGELIDGLAGGMCQIASTLHAASFFAGLEIVSSTPHSRPSSYVPMALDSTVVYPTTDLKLRNPYDFPVVMHYVVNQGSVKVELLGKERPYRVIFEREVKGEYRFTTEERPDPTAPEGQRIMLQAGYPGYALVRRRYIFPKDQVPKWNVGREPLQKYLDKHNIKAEGPPGIKAVQQWGVRYPSTTEIVGVGAGEATLKKKPPPPAHKIPPLKGQDKPIARLLR